MLKANYPINSSGMDNMSTVIRGPFEPPVCGSCLCSQSTLCPQCIEVSPLSLQRGVVITHPLPPSPLQRCCFPTPGTHFSDRKLVEPHKNAGWWLTFCIPAALLGRSSALSSSFLPHVTALLLFKRSFCV